MTTSISADSPAVVPLDGIEAIGDTLQSVLADTRYECLSALPDEARYDAALMRTSWDKDVEMMARGVDSRFIYPARAARDPEFMEYLTQFAARGAKIRILGSVPNRMVISDRMRAVVPDAPVDGGVRALLVTGKPLVRALYAQFVDLWRASMPVGFSTGGLDVDLIRDTLQALSKGMTDEAAARTYGWSLRTYRRRIAAVLDLLGTSSRFEAGALAREQGWI